MSFPDLSFVKSGKSILFLGAGFSADAINHAGEGVKDVGGLISHLLTSIGVDSSEGYDLDTAAQEFIDAFDGNAELELSKLIHDNFSAKKYTDSQRVVACQPWFRIYTTNYDNVVENIYAEEGKLYTEKAIHENVEPPIGCSQIIHIYGSIRNLSPGEFKKSFLLTERQRDASPFLKSPWYRRFNDDVLAAKAIFFVGFSMSDIDLRRLLSALPSEVNAKIHFITWAGEKKPILTRLKKFGTVHTCAVEGFAGYLGQKRTGHAELSVEETPIAMEKVEFTPQAKAKISSQDIQSLLLSGDIDRALLSQSDTEGSSGSYTIPRSKSLYERALSAAQKGKPIILHGDIGNGKTTSACVLGYYFNLSGYDVYNIRREPENVGEIISYIQAQSGRKVLIVLDDIMKFSTLPSAILNIGSSEVCLLGTVRSNTLDTSRHLIDQRLGHKSFISLDLNVANRIEVDSWIRYLNENGLFGDRSDISEKAKAELISKRCGGQMRDVMLELYSKGSLHVRVSEFLDSISQLSQDSQDIIALSSLLTLCNFRELASYANLSELTGAVVSFDEFKSEALEKDLSGLLSLKNGLVEIRSPALALFILRRTYGLERTLVSAKAALFYINDYLSDEHDFSALGKMLLKYSTYGEIARTKSDGERLERFYDECRVLIFANSDPLFWVQRSICCMKIPNFSLASDFVETSFGTAKKMANFDTYQIENHAARLKLTQSLVEGMSDSGEREREASVMLRNVVSRKSDDLYHPLSVMRLFNQIAVKYAATMNQAQCSSMAEAIAASLKIVESKGGISGRFRGISELKRSLRTAQSLVRKREENLT